MLTGRRLGGTWLTGWPSMKDFAAAGLLEASDHAQGGGLPQPLSPNYGEEFTLGNGESSYGQQPLLRTARPPGNTLVTSLSSTAVSLIVKAVITS
ncbi:MAG: hypothetical protein H6658_12990 [Ardenticatenaceae bacterium]|nr:hypothetical protein [Ardenticatenaceae bacterium]